MPSTAYTDNLAAFDAAQAKLAATSIENLLASAYRLTHSMDRATRNSQDAPNRYGRDLHLREATSLRLQRDLITAEVCRRATA